MRKAMMSTNHSLFSGTYVTFRYMLQQFRLSVCHSCLSVTFMHPTKTVNLFGNIFGTQPKYGNGGVSDADSSELGIGRAATLLKTLLQYYGNSITRSTPSRAWGFQAPEIVGGQGRRCHCMQPGWCQPVIQDLMENECEALPGVANPGVRD